MAVLTVNFKRQICFRNSSRHLFYLIPEFFQKSVENKLPKKYKVTQYLLDYGNYKDKSTAIKSHYDFAETTKSTVLICFLRVFAKQKLFNLGLWCCNFNFVRISPNRESSQQILQLRALTIIIR